MIEDYMYDCIVDYLVFLAWWRIKELNFVFAEQTFIVLDKQLIVGEFKHGEAHEEG